MKLTGLLFLAAAFLGFAFVKLDTYKSRFRQLQRIISFLDYIERELSAQPVQFQEMFAGISGKINSDDGLIFKKLAESLELLGDKSFQNIWEETINSFFYGLSSDEKQEIYRLSSILGFCPVDMQINSLSACKNYYSDILKREKSEYPQNRKLYLGLSAAAAGALIIVFI